MSTKNKLYRSREHRILGGVCAGLAYYFETDPLLVRLIFLLTAGGGSVILYIVLWIVLPEMPHEEHGEHKDTAHQAEVVEHPKKYDDEHYRKVVGFFLLLIGIIYFLNNFIPAYGMSQLWPLILVFLGLILIFRHRRNRKHKE